MSGPVTATHYRRLGLAPGAPADEVKRAFRQLAIKYHPDHNPDDRDAERHFREVRAAYEAIVAARFPGPSQVRVPAGSAPRSRPAAQRPHASAPPRRAPVPTTTPRQRTVGALHVGDRVQVAPDAILVAPDRSVFLAPGAPMLDRHHPHAITVSRGLDGFRVTIPASTAYRWPISRRAAAEGLSVQAVEAGASSSSRRRTPLSRLLRRPARNLPTSQMPVHLLNCTLEKLADQQTAWTVADAFFVDGRGRAWLDLAGVASQEPTVLTSVRVTRRGGGYHIAAMGDQQTWTRRSRPTSSHREVDVARLDGVIIRSASASA